MVATRSSQRASADGNEPPPSSTAPKTVEASAPQEAHRARSSVHILPPSSNSQREPEASPIAPQPITAASTIPPPAPVTASMPPPARPITMQPQSLSQDAITSLISRNSDVLLPIRIDWFQPTVTVLEYFRRYPDTLNTIVQMLLDLERNDNMHIRRVEGVEVRRQGQGGPMRVPRKLQPAEFETAMSSSKLQQQQQQGPQGGLPARHTPNAAAMSAYQAMQQTAELWLEVLLRIREMLGYVLQRHDHLSRQSPAARKKYAEALEVAWEQAPDPELMEPSPNVARNLPDNRWAVPQHILDLVARVMAVKRNQFGMPIRSRLGTEVATDFTTDGHLNRRSALRGYADDERVFTPQLWSYVLSGKQEPLPRSTSAQPAPMTKQRQKLPTAKPRTLQEASRMPGGVLHALHPEEGNRVRNAENDDEEEDESSQPEARTAAPDNAELSKKRASKKRKRSDHDGEASFSNAAPTLREEATPSITVQRVKEFRGALVGLVTAIHSL